MNRRTAANRNFYEAYWRAPDATREALWKEWWEPAYARLLELAGDLRGRRVLVLFAGDGALLPRLAAAGAGIVAVDLASSGLRRIRARDSVPVVQADVHELPFAAATFDLVVPINGLCHTDAARVLREAARVLRPHGRVVLLEVLRWSPVALLARLFDPFFWRAPHRLLSLRRIRGGLPLAARRVRTFFLASVLGVCLLRLAPRSRVLRALQRGLLAFDHALLRAVPALGHLAYVGVAELAAPPAANPTPRQRAAPP